MIQRNLHTALATALAVCAIGVSGNAFAYNQKDAIRDCNQRIGSEYGVGDFRHESAQQLMDSEHHYKVTGKVKVDGQQYPYGCEIKKRHVVAIDYNGPKPKGMDTSQKLALGAAAAIATGIAVNAMTKDKGGSATPAPAPAAPAPKVKTLSGGRMEVAVSPSCTVQFNDIGMRSSATKGCTASELSAANKAVTAHLSEQRANAR